FDPTKMCAVGRIVGSSTSVPSVTWTKAPSRTTEYRSEPQAASGVVRALVAEDDKLVRSPGDIQLGALDAAERLERGAGRTTAAGAVTVQRIAELVRYCVVDRTAKTHSAECASATGFSYRCFAFAHAATSRDDYRERSSMP